MDRSNAYSTNAFDTVSIRSPLTGLPSENFLPRGTLKLWVEQAGKTSPAVHPAVINESFPKARYINLKKTAKFKKEAHEVIDQCTIQKAASVPHCNECGNLWYIYP
jgi:hypothetical protein